MELEFIGVKKACSDTKRLQGPYGGEYCNLMYDISTGEVWTDLFCDFERGSYVAYKDPDIILCGVLTSPTTMRDIKEIITDAVNEKRWMDKIVTWNDVTHEWEVKEDWDK